MITTPSLAATKFAELASQDSIERALSALKQNGIEAYFVQTEAEAKNKVLAVLPKGAEVMTMTSETLAALGIHQAVDESGNYDSSRKKLMSMDRTKQGREMQRLGAAPEWVLGSVHAITEDGKLMIASNTGSQLPAYAFGAGKVILVAGTQKIVRDLSEGLQRIYEYCLPRESERAKKAYGAPGSAVNKILVLNREPQPERIIVIMVNEVLGF